MLQQQQKELNKQLRKLYLVYAESDDECTGNEGRRDACGDDAGVCAAAGKCQYII